MDLVQDYSTILAVHIARSIGKFFGEGMTIRNCLIVCFFAFGFACSPAAADELLGELDGAKFGALNVDQPISLSATGQIVVTHVVAADCTGNVPTSGSIYLQPGGDPQRHDINRGFFIIGGWIGLVRNTVMIAAPQLVSGEPILPVVSGPTTVYFRMDGPSPAVTCNLYVMGERIPN